MKEVAATAMIALTAGLVPVRRSDLRSARAQIPFALAAAATLGVLSITGIIWVGLLAVPALVLVARVPRRTWKSAAAGIAAVAVLAIPSLVIASEFIHYTRSNLLTHDERYGNLIRALPLTEAFGIWPGGDFRVDPTHSTVTTIAIAIAAVAVAGGAVFAAARRRIRLPLAAATVAVAALFLELDSSPWLTGKALASASPFLVALALAGAAALGHWSRVAGGLLAVVLAAGVLYSDALGYRAAWIAPHGQLAELEQIGKAFAGQGPALMTEYQPYGVRHLLRSLDAEGASELRVHLVPLADGSSLATGQYANIDQFRYPDLLFYRTLVLRRSPTESRPGAPYQLVFRGRYYDVWQRAATGGPTVIEHVPLGDQYGPSSVPACATVRQVAARAAAAHGEIAAATTPNPIFVPLSTGDLPGGWTGSPGDPDSVTPSGDGTLHATARVPMTGVYTLWINGVILRRVSVAIDGRRVGSVDESGSLYAPLGTTRLAAGTHRVELSFGDPALAPGGAAPAYRLGPLALSPAGLPAPVAYLAPSRAASLCGTSLDWLEAVTP
jgi:hypothetical protein